MLFDRLWGFLVLSWVSFTLWTALVFHWDAVGRLDRYCYELAARGASSEVWTSCMGKVTFLGDGRWVCGLCGLLALFLLLRRNPAAALWLFCSLLAGIWLTWMLKALCGRPRPEGFLASWVLPNYGYPSGHTFNAVFFYCVGLRVLARKRVRFFCSGWARAVTALVVVAVGVSRVSLGVHWASDVIGGALSGLVWLALNLMWMERFRLLEADAGPRPPPPLSRAL